MTNIFFIETRLIVYHIASNLRIYYDKIKHVMFEYFEGLY